MNTIKYNFNKINFTPWGEGVDPMDGIMTDVLVIARDSIMKCNPDITTVVFVEPSWNSYTEDKIIWTVEKKGQRIIVWNEKEFKAFPA